MPTLFATTNAGFTKAPQIYLPSPSFLLPGHYHTRKWVLSGFFFYLGKIRLHTCNGRILVLSQIKGQNDWPGKLSCWAFKELFSHKKNFVKNSCQKKLKMVENWVENEIKLGEPTMRVLRCWEWDRCEVCLTLTEPVMVTTWTQKWKIPFLQDFMTQTFILFWHKTSTKIVPDTYFSTLPSFHSSFRKALPERNFAKIIS